MNINSSPLALGTENGEAFAELIDPNIFTESRDVEGVVACGFDGLDGARGVLKRDLPDGFVGVDKCLFNAPKGCWVKSLPRSRANTPQLIAVLEDTASRSMHKHMVLTLINAHLRHDPPAAVVVATEGCVARDGHGAELAA